MNYIAELNPAEDLPSVPSLVNLSPSARVRRTPFSDRVEMAGVRGYTVYNHMLLPTLFRTTSEDYAHLCNYVQVWDVGCERQVEIAGPDAARLVQMMTPRNLAKAVDLQCLYVPLCGPDGNLINDPIAIRLSADRWWLSIADSDVLLWAKGLAYGMKLDVTIREPDVWPLAVQGPLSDELMTRVFGPEVTGLKFFRSGWFKYKKHTFLIARSGWSHQGGFEIYVDDADLGTQLWDELFGKGFDLQVAPGCPNLIERIEAGLISYGGDVTMAHNPYEMGLDKYCHPEQVDCIGREALLKVKENGPDRRIRGLKLDTALLGPCAGGWQLATEDGTFAGTVSAAALSPKFGAIAVAMVERPFMEAGTMLKLTTPNGIVDAKVCDLPMTE